MAWRSWERGHGGHGDGGHGWSVGHGGHGDGGHWSGGWDWGWPWFGFGVAADAILGYPYYYQTYPYYPAYDPYWYGYDPAYNTSPGVIYHEPEYEPDQDDESTGDSANGSGYWYFCRKSNAYYPYVRKCAGGWEKVPALPPPSDPDDDR